MTDYMTDGLDALAAEMIEKAYQAYLDNIDAYEDAVPFDEWDPADYEDTSEYDIPKRQ